MSVTVESVLKMTSMSVPVDFTAVPLCEPQYVDSKSSERSVQINVCSKNTVLLLQLHCLLYKIICMMRN